MTTAVTDEGIMAANNGTIPSRIVAAVHYSPTEWDGGWSWHWTVDAYSLHDPEGDPAIIDYGSATSKENGWLAVENTLANRAAAENPEFVHVRSDKRRKRQRGVKVETTSITYAIEVDEGDYGTSAHMQNAVVGLLTSCGFSVTSIVPGEIRAT